MKGTGIPAWDGLLPFPKNPGTDAKRGFWSHFPNSGEQELRLGGRRCWAHLPMGIPGNSTSRGLDHALGWIFCTHKNQDPKPTPKPAQIPKPTPKPSWILKPNPKPSRSTHARQGQGLLPLFPPNLWDLRIGWDLGMWERSQPINQHEIPAAKLPWESMVLEKAMEKRERWKAVQTPSPKTFHFSSRSLSKTV